MKTVGNILWFLLSGAWLALMWLVCGIVCCCTIIMIPVGVQCFKFAGFVLWPFGKEIYPSFSSGHILLNIIWVIVFGLWLAITSVIVGLMWCITIIGIPFGVQCIKFAKLAFLPFGSEIR